MSESQKIGRYEIVEEKGRGAMGSVYIARDPAMDRVVALKTIHSLALQGPQGAEYRERFYREARASGRLAHPGIVPMFDVGEQDGLPYLVMEYIEGQTLAEAAKGGQRFTLERVCEIGQQIAEALGYAHKNGVVHRDIKPANILLTSKEKYGIERPKITDFGIAKLSAAELTTTGQMLGTPAFMPPEQFTGASIDGRSDLFSLGVILYWLATGEQAFPGETVTAVSYKVVHTEPVPPRKLNPAVPAGLENVIIKTLAKDPAARFQTGEDLAHELGAVRAGRSTPELKSAVNITVAPGAGSGMDVTLDSDVAVQTTEAVRQSAINAVPTQQTAASKKKSGGASSAILGISAAAVVLLAGIYVYKQVSKVRRAPQTVASETQIPATAAAPVASAPIPVPEAANSAEPPAVTTDATKPDPPASRGATAVPPAKKSSKLSKSPKDASKTATTTPAATAVIPVPAPAATVPAPTPTPAPPARVDFDPKSLNPNENTRLRVEAEKFPAKLDFTLELNGKIFFERGSANTQTAFEDLFIPPGVQELRVIAGSGANRKSSNIVSAEFKAKKRKTLRLELRIQGKSSDAGVPQDVYPDSQIFITLK